jgi:ligand-binding sensor domain-containing protein
VRYDGNQMRPWAKDIINRDVFTLAASPKGEVVVAEGAGMLYVVTANGVTPVVGRNNAPFPEVLRAEFDAAGRLWVLTENDEVYYRDEQNVWRSLDVKTTFSGEVPNRFRRATGDRIHVVTNRGVWETRAGESPRKIAEVRGAIDAVTHPDGSLFVLAWSRIPGGTGVFEVRDGQAKMRVPLTYRPIELAVRGRVIWASTSHTLISLRGGESPDIMGPEHDLPGGGPLLVDHEGSLWLGTFAGLLQYPEPETLIWNQKDGLSSAHTRFLEKTEEGIWVVIWGPFARVARDEKGWHVYNQKISSLICVNDEGVLFANTADAVVARRDGRFVKHSPLPGGVGFRTCAHARDGTLLFATERGIFRDNAGKQPELVSSPLGDDGQPASIFKITEDRKLRLWASTSDGRICRSSVSAVLSGQAGVWSCQLIPGSPDMVDIMELPSGSIWMATNRAGVWRWNDNHWETIPASRNLASRALFNLAASPLGGVWVVGHGTAIRVIEHADSAEGWKVIEGLSPWHGLAASDAGDLIDEPDGSLWLTTSVGVLRVPPEARRAEASPPRVKLVDVVINGRSTNAAANSSSLPYGSQVELHFAALSYRDRGRLRYQYRLRSDAPWIDSNDSAPVLRFVDLGAGDYQAEVRASLDGVSWTAVPARLSFQVLSPWYLRPITFLLLAIVVAAILYAIYRARLRSIMRLERQRTQIARDLHDEMGSGLGSIGSFPASLPKTSLARRNIRRSRRKLRRPPANWGSP